MKKLVLSLLLLVALLTACTPARPRMPTATPQILPTATAAATSTPPAPTPTIELPVPEQPTETPTPKPPTPTPVPATPTPERVRAKVARVVDGDTIEVEIAGKRYTVRYIGIDTPETKHPQKPVEWMGLEAAAKNEELVGGKIVELEKDVSETDRYGRLLRYVWVGDLMVNAELVRLGFAQVSTYPPDVRYADLFLNLQREAREAGRGLWGPTPTCTPILPTATYTPAPPTPVEAPAEAALTIEIESLTSPVRPGAHATLVIRTLPGAYCTITVYYKSGPSKAKGLDPKEADEAGRVSWTWKVGTKTTPGTWSIVVTASIDGQTASVRIPFEVQ